MKQTILITSGRMAGFLMLNGMRLLFVKKDLKDRSRHVFVFDDTPLLRKYMEQYPRAKEAAYQRREKIAAG